MNAAVVVLVASMCVICLAGELRPRDQAWLERHFDVYVLGEAIYDQYISFTADEQPQLEQLLSELGLSVGGGCLISDAQVDSILRRHRPFYAAAGGAACNTCAGVALLGGRAVFSGVVADDALGGLFARDMAAYPNLTVRLRTVSDPLQPLHTGTVIALLDASGERTLPAHPGVAVLAAYPGDVDDAELLASKLVFVEGYLWAAGDNWRMIDALFDHARSAGVHTAFTVGDAWICRSRGQQLRQLVARTDVVFSDAEQMAALLDLDPTTDIDALAAAAAAAVGGVAVITRGSQGAAIVTRTGHVHHIPVVPVDPAHIVDTTGAGDQFAAGFLFAYARGSSLPDCGRFAAATAARILVQYGAKPPPPLIQLDEQATILS